MRHIVICVGELLTSTHLLWLATMSGAEGAEAAPPPRLTGCGAAGGSAGDSIALATKLIVSQKPLPGPPAIDLDAVEPGAYVVMSAEHHAPRTSDVGTFEDATTGQEWTAGDLMMLPPKGAFVFVSDYTIVLIALERLLL